MPGVRVVVRHRVFQLNSHRVSHNRIPRGRFAHPGRSVSRFGVEPVADALLVVVGCSFEVTDQLSRGLRARALRKARDELARGSFRTLTIVQHFGKECCLVEETILVLRVLPLRRLVLIERFLRLAEETEAIAELELRPTELVACNRTSAAELALALALTIRQNSSWTIIIKLTSIPANVRCRRTMAMSPKRAGS